MAHSHEHQHGAHDHGHGHAGHDHGAGATETVLLWALLLTAGFMVAEAIGGWIAGSLALVADAAHMLADTGSLAMSYAAVRATRRPPSELMSYGHHRWPVLAAFVNGLVLLVLSAWIIGEAVSRLLSPRPVLAGTMMVVATLGVAVNIVSYLILSRGDRSLNVRSALLHVASDILSNAGALLAGTVIWYTHWLPIDPILSLVMAALIVRGGYRVTRESAHILLEGAPSSFDAAQIEREIMTGVPTVAAVHHVHCWSLTGEQPMATLHAVLHVGADQVVTLAGIHQILRVRLGIGHATVQLEVENCGSECKPVADGSAADPVKRLQHG
jgi:cobalt-zinc-cadmium efflux system protein